jgi:dipeptidyl aminopeptidase/acylaminoacyl peptidase
VLLRSAALSWTLLALGCNPAQSEALKSADSRSTQAAVEAIPVPTKVEPVVTTSAKQSGPALTAPVLSAPVVSNPVVSNVSDIKPTTQPTVEKTVTNEAAATDKVAKSAKTSDSEQEAKPAKAARAATDRIELAVAPDAKFAEAVVPGPAYLAGVPLINREVFFGNPDKAAARLSPDATRLSYLAAVDGVMNIWVGPADNPNAAKPITHDKKRGIQIYFWAYTNQHILYLQDKDGDEDWHVYSVDLKSGETRDLTPLEKVAAQIEGVSYKFPQDILVGLNNRDPQVHDIYRVNLASGERTLIQKNEQGFTGFVTDEDYRVRFASRFSPDGGRELLEPDGQGGWKQYLRIPMADEMTTNPAGFDKSGDVLYMLDSRDRNTAALYSVNLKTQERKLLASNDKADVGGVLSHPTENTIEAVSFTYTREQWDILDPRIDEDFRYLRTLEEGDIQIPSRSLDDKTWIVAFLEDNGPIRYYRYQREPVKDAKFLFTNRKSLEGLPLVKMHPLVIKSRDNMNLVSYLSLPPGTDEDGDARPQHPVPLVLDVHGGPWARDDWGYNPQHQLWANRGYAVLSVNFRGSTGFGKAFINAGNKEWMGRMHDDLLDAVDHCVKHGIADPAKIAILGGSYGGYATLVGLTKTPDVFACGVDIVGPSNIITLLNTIPPYWQPAIQLFRDRVGDHTTEEGRKFLLERSPLTHVEQIKRPLLIAQGANDPRVKQAEADQIVRAMTEKKIPVVYVLYPDEGHGFARPANRLSFNAVTEAFLAKYLGGRYQAIGDDFRGSTISVPTGAAGVPGLEESLKQNAETVK